MKQKQDKVLEILPPCKLNESEEHAPEILLQPRAKFGYSNGSTTWI